MKIGSKNKTDKVKITKLIVLTLVLLTTNAWAHRVIIFAWVEGDRVYTESKFSGGKKPKNALVEVFNGQSKKIVTGKTNDKGEFSFKVPAPRTEMKIVLNAGTGHRGEWTLPLQELQKKTASPKISVKNTNNCNCVATEDIEKIIDQKLKPILQKLNQSLNPQQAPRISDILGGIGYILGLMGIGAYFNYRKGKS